MLALCPRCKEECEGEAPHKPWFYAYECECGFEFSYDDYSSIYYDTEGNELNDVFFREIEEKKRNYMREDGSIGHRRQYGK